MRIDNNIKAVLALAFALNAAYALDPMYDYRYTLGPEIVVPDAFHAGFGGWTHYNEDLSLAANFQLGLMDDEFEIGFKYILTTNQDWLTAKKDERRHSGKLNESLIDVGFKYAIDRHLALQADVPMKINKDMEWSGILSLTKFEGFARNVSFIYEGRLGFGGLPGDNSYVKPAASVTPYFQIGSSFRMSVSVVSSCSVGDMEDFKNDFMLDILPRLEFGFTQFRLTGEVAIGILTYGGADGAEKYNRYAVFLVSDI